MGELSRLCKWKKCPFVPNWVIVREDPWNTYVYCGPKYVYFLSSPNNLIMHAIATTYMVSIDYATNWVVFHLLVLQIVPLENAIFLIWTMQMELTILNIIFLGWHGVLIDLIIILMKVGTSNPYARASIGGWLTHLMRTYPMF